MYMWFPSLPRLIYIQIYLSVYLVGGFNPLWKIWVSGDDFSQYGKKNMFQITNQREREREIYIYIDIHVNHDSGQVRGHYNLPPKHVVRQENFRPSHDHGVDDWIFLGDHSAKKRSGQSQQHALRRPLNIAWSRRYSQFLWIVWITNIV